MPTRWTSCAVAALLLCAACGGGEGGPGGSLAAAHDIKPARFGTSSATTWLERGPGGALVVMIRESGVGAYGESFSETSVHLSRDEGSSWVRQDVAMVDPNTPPQQVPEVFAAAGPGSVQLLSLESNFVLRADGEWVEGPALSGLLAAAADEYWNIQAAAILDFEIDGAGRLHFLTSSINERLFYHRFEGGQRTSWSVNDAIVKQLGTLVVGLEDAVFAVYQDGTAGREGEGLKVWSQRFGPGGPDGGPVALPLQETAEAFGVAPSVAEWGTMLLTSSSGGGVAHAAGVQRRGDDWFLWQLPFTAAGVGTVTILDACFAGACWYGEVSVEPDLALYDDATAAWPHLFATRHDSTPDGGVQETVLVSRLAGTLPSPAVVSSRLTEFKAAGARFDFRGMQLLQWPALEFAYHEGDGIRYTQGGIGEDEGFSFDELVLRRVLATAPSYVVAWLSAPPEADSLGAAACTIEPALPILSVAPTPLGAGIVLETARQEPGRTYTLSCPGVADGDARRALAPVTFPGFGADQADWETYRAPYGVHGMAVDPAGRLWTVGQFGVDVLGPERVFWRHVPMEIPDHPPEDTPPGQIAVSADGRVWVEPTGASLLDRFAVWDGAWSLYEAGTLPGARPGHDRRFMATPDGAIWVSTDGWLHRVDLEEPVSLDLASTGIDTVRALASVPGGGLWVLYDRPGPAGNLVAGLARYDGAAWGLLEDRVVFDDGRQGDFAALALDGDGRVWALADVSYQTRNGHGFTTHLASRNPDGTWAELTEVTAGSTALHVDATGRIWAAGLVTTGPDGPLLVPAAAGGGPIASDLDGSIWTAGSGPVPTSAIARVFLTEEIRDGFTRSACERGGAPVSLTVSLSLQGGAAGTVTSLPAGIDCPGTCTASFPRGCPVRLTAAATGGKLLEWTGPCSGGEECVVVLQEDTEVGAVFHVPLVGWTEAFPVADAGHVEGIGSDAAGSLALVARFRGSAEIGALRVEGVTATLPNLFVARFGADREPLWARRIGSADGNLGAARLRLLPDGDVLVATVPTGSDLDVGEGSLGPGSGRDMVIVRYEASSGAVSRVHRYGKVASGAWEGVDLAVDGQGRAYAVAASVAGLDFGGGFSAGPGGFLLVLAPDGEIDRVSGALGPVHPYMVAAAPDGRTLISVTYTEPVDLGTGPLPYDMNLTNAALVGLDAGGGVLWARPIEGLPNDLFVTADGRLGYVVDAGVRETTILDDNGQPASVWPHGAARGSVAVRDDGALALVGAWSNLGWEPGKSAATVTVLAPDGDLLWTEVVHSDPGHEVRGAAWVGDRLVFGGTGYAVIGQDGEALTPPGEDAPAVVFMAGLDR